MRPSGKYPYWDNSNCGNEIIPRITKLRQISRSRRVAISLFWRLRNHSQNHKTAPDFSFAQSRHFAFFGGYEIIPRITKLRQISRSRRVAILLFWRLRNHSQNHKTAPDFSLAQSRHFAFLAVTKSFPESQNCARFLARAESPFRFFWRLRNHSQNHKTAPDFSLAQSPFRFFWRLRNHSQNHKTAPDFSLAQSRHFVFFGGYEIIPRITKLRQISRSRRVAISLFLAVTKSFPESQNCARFLARAESPFRFFWRLLNHSQNHKTAPDFSLAQSRHFAFFGCANCDLSILGRAKSHRSFYVMFYI